MRTDIPDKVECVTKNCGSYATSRKWTIAPTLYEFARPFQAVYVCDRCAIYNMMCLKCSKVLKSHSSLIHIHECYYGNNRDDLYRIRLGTGVEIYIDDLLSEIPQITYFNIDYMSDAILEIAKRSDDRNPFGYRDYLDFHREEYREIVSSILKQDVYCLFCECYFDCFPTKDQLRKHIELCEYQPKKLIAC